MAQNFLYMFEFVVDDLLITRPNFCAPEEYPTCCEISFRSSVFVTICDREFGKCVDPCAPKCGKCCLFSLESPVSDKDRLLIHIYKKKTEMCKFLIGATDLPIKALFDKVTESFNIENPNWMEQMANHTANLPDPKTPSKTMVVTVDNDCDNDESGRREQMCCTSEMTKRLLPLFNMKGCQTGNLVLIIRLVCNGPAIVSSFPFSKVCSVGCGKKKTCPAALPEPPKDCDPCAMPDPCLKKEKKPPACRRYFACNADKPCPCEECEDDCDRECPSGCAKEKLEKANAAKNKGCSGCSGRQNACKKQQAAKGPSCQRYFGGDDSCGQRAVCTCDDCMEACEAEDDESECVEEEESEEDCLHPCFVEPTQPEPGPEAYDEFEACLNGSGLVIRVLKNTHQVQDITDGTENNLEDSEDDCDKCQKDNDNNSECESISDILQRSGFARNHIKRRTAGHIINNAKLPKIRANIKYSGNDSCCPPSSYHVPFSKIKQMCDRQQNKLDLYRRKQGCQDSCGPIEPPKCPEDTRNCCLQVDPKELKNALKGINTDTRKKGIEVCYKACDDTDSDVFLVKLGSKQRCQKKKNTIEIELRTPKQPITLPKQKVTTETQINEATLDAELSGVCKKGKKGKGKKGKKK